MVIYAPAIFNCGGGVYSITAVRTYTRPSRQYVIEKISVLYSNSNIQVYK